MRSWEELTPEERDVVTVLFQELDPRRHKWDVRSQREDDVVIYDVVYMDMVERIEDWGTHYRQWQGRRRGWVTIRKNPEMVWKPAWPLYVKSHRGKKVHRRAGRGVTACGATMLGHWVACDGPETCKGCG